jgi:hypothetical protein
MRSATQAELARALKAARKAGVRVVDVKLKDGTVIRVPLTEAVESDLAPLAPEKEIVL